MFQPDPNVMMSRRMQYHTFTNCNPIFSGAVQQLCDLQTVTLYTAIQVTMYDDININNAMQFLRLLYYNTSYCINKYTRYDSN